MSESETGFSKRFALEIPTGKTKKITGQGGRAIRTVPITQRFPPDRRRSFRTKTTYTKDDKTGRITNGKVKLFQEITKEQG